MIQSVVRRTPEVLICGLERQRKDVPRTRYVQEGQEDCELALPSAEFSDGITDRIIGWFGLGNGGFLGRRFFGHVGHGFGPHFV